MWFLDVIDFSVCLRNVSFGWVRNFYYVIHLLGPVSFIWQCPDEREKLDRIIPVRIIVLRGQGGLVDKVIVDRTSASVQG